MPKQQTTATVPESQDPYELTESNLRSWLLGSFDKQREFLEQSKKRMLAERVSPELIARCINYETSIEENVIKETLKLVTNPKTGKLWDIPTLENAGKLSDAEVESIRAEHGGRDPPYYYVTNIHRILDDRSRPSKEWLVYDILFEGLSSGTREGVIIPEPNMKINESATIGYYLMPRVTWNDVKDKDGEKKRVATFNGSIVDTPDTRNYWIPFEKEIVQALLKHTKDGQIPALTITQVSTSKHYGVRTLEEFLEPAADFIKRINTPKPAVDTASLLDDLERRAREKAEKDAKDKDQYQ